MTGLSKHELAFQKKYRDKIDTAKKEHGAIPAITGSYSITIDGKKSEKSYTVIGPPGYADKIANLLKDQGNDIYGQRKLAGIAASSKPLMFVYNRGGKDEKGNYTGDWSAVSTPDPYGAKGSTKYANIIFLDTDTKLKAWTQPTDSNLKYSSYNNMSNPMIMGHELTHIWQFNSNSSAPGANYFTRENKRQPFDFKFDKNESVILGYDGHAISISDTKEGDATRYQNQSRYIRNLPFYRSKYADSVDHHDKSGKKHTENAYNTDTLDAIKKRIYKDFPGGVEEAKNKAKNNHLEVIANTSKSKTAEEVALGVHLDISKQMRTEKSKPVNVPEIDM